MRAGGALELGLAFPPTLATAGTLAAHGGHLVGAPGSDAGDLLLMGWSREVGDLRVPHFFATHAMHAVPLAAALLVPLFGPRSVWPAIAIAAGYSAAVLAIFAEALLGLTFLPGPG